ncbi:MAG: SAM-dependent methyltransferase [Clostridia bacterium]|nr:SAM-dependent methyltransferase [Clostridia bacterium]
MLPLRLDERLSAALALFPVCDIGADIGCDHGKLALNLLYAGKVKRMIAADLSAVSLQKARRLFEAHQMADRARFLAGDGFSALDEPVDAAAILGMGGDTLSGILLKGKERLNGCSLILSAHTCCEHVRRTLGEIGYHIADERIALAAGRYYVVLRAEYGHALEPDERQLFLGPMLSLGAPDQQYWGYLTRRLAAYEDSQSSEGQKRRDWLKEEMIRVQAYRTDGL